MKKRLTLLLALAFFVTNCGLDKECLADMAVTSLSAPGAVASGDIVQVICIIKNVITTAVGCTSSEDGTVAVSYGYSPTYKESFSEYEEFHSYTEDLASYEKDEGQEDIMEMPTDKGPGYYAMKVIVDHGNDDNPDNDSRAVTIRAD